MGEGKQAAGKTRPSAAGGVAEPGGKQNREGKIERRYMCIWGLFRRFKV